jgi:hypothetical protein
MMKGGGKPDKAAAIRVYADTSVYGGVFDREFTLPSTRFFTLAKAGRFELVTSALVEAEIRSAPEWIRQFYRATEACSQVAEIQAHSLRLAEAYLAAGIVGPKSLTDARHVALATVSRCRLIVSWNFKHIVQFERIEGYNRVNVVSGYEAIGIYSPLEVISGEEDDNEGDTKR